MARKKLLNDDIIIELISLRQHLHRNPELSGEEFQTAKSISEFLLKYNPEELISNIGGTGLAAVYNFGSNGPTVMVRSELDALPIQEINTFEHKSTIDGKSHKCGHDGHMVMLAGLAPLLNKMPWKKGKVILLFQPAEETGEGAQWMLDDEIFKKIVPDYVLALHNLPGIEKNTVVCKNMNFTASVKSMIIKLFGKTAHAGEPEFGINPAQAIAEIIQQGLKLQQAPDSVDFAVVTPIQIEMGEEAFGISAGYGEVKFTLRSWTNPKMEEVCDKMEFLVKSIAIKYGLQVDISYTQYFSATENDAEMVEIIERNAGKNGFKYIDNHHPFKWGEDFGLFTQKYKGAMFGIGSGVECAALHNPDYDFPDDIISVGTSMFYSVIDELLGD